MLPFSESRVDPFKEEASLGLLKPMGTCLSLESMSVHRFEASDLSDRNRRGKFYCPTGSSSPKMKSY